MNIPEPRRQINGRCRADASIGPADGEEDLLPGERQVPRVVIEHRNGSVKLRKVEQIDNGRQKHVFDRLSVYGCDQQGDVASAGDPYDNLDVVHTRNRAGHEGVEGFATVVHLPPALELGLAWGVARNVYRRDLVASACQRVSNDRVVRVGKSVSVREQQGARLIRQRPFSIAATAKQQEQRKEDWLHEEIVVGGTGSEPPVASLSAQSPPRQQGEPTAHSAGSPMTIFRGVADVAR